MCVFVYAFVSMSIKIISLEVESFVNGMSSWQLQRIFHFDENKNILLELYDCIRGVTSINYIHIYASIAAKDSLGCAHCAPVCIIIIMPVSACTRTIEQTVCTILPAAAVAAATAQRMKSKVNKTNDAG